MISITENKDKSGLLIEGDEIARAFHQGGVLSSPKNSVLLIMDENTEMLSFKSAFNYDTFFTCLISDTYIEGVQLTRETAIPLFNKISNRLSQGGGGSGECDCEVVSFNPYLNWGETTTIANVNGVNIDVTMPNKPSGGGGSGDCDLEEVYRKLDKIYDQIKEVDCSLDKINGTEICGYLGMDGCELLDEINSCKTLDCENG